MKKTLIVTILVLMIALSSVGPAFAQKDKINIKGEVTAVDGGSLTVESNKGDTYVITVPDGIDVSAIQVGDSVLIKAAAGEGGAWGMALLAAYAIRTDRNLTLPDFLDEAFAQSVGEAVAPDPEDLRGFDAYFKRYHDGLGIERAAVDSLE